MAAIVIRNIPEATHRALKARAKAHGRSAEAEMRAILEEVVQPEIAESKNMVDALLALGRRYGGIELDIERDKTPPPAIDFE